MSFRRRRHGFTLVELLIVIVAMAILAGIVIPQVGESIDDATESAMLTNLHELTSAVERYKIEHNGEAPLLSGNTLPQLTSRTDQDGNIGNDASYPHGPYMVGGIPVNPLNNSAVVTETLIVPPGDLASQSGWVYYELTGQLWAGQLRTQ